MTDHGLTTNRRCVLSRQAVDLAEGDLALLADVLDTTPHTLSDELGRRPWFVNDLLREPAVIELALGHDTTQLSHLSPNLFFSIVAFHAADELCEATWVADWISPKSRLPVFDVEPLLEFSDNPRRLAFVARLLAGFAAPEAPPVPVDAFDFADLVRWLDAVEPDTRTVLLCRLGDLALFMAGVFPDATGAAVLDIADADALGRSVGMDPDEVLELVDAGSTTPGLTAMETLGAAWYNAAAADERATPKVIVDIAARIRPARRFLNHVADRYLTPGDMGWALGA